MNENKKTWVILRIVIEEDMVDSSIGLVKATEENAVMHLGVLWHSVSVMMKILLSVQHTFSIVMTATVVSTVGLYILKTMKFVIR